MIDAPRPVAGLRVLHTSDWHLGHELHGHGREAEHAAFLDWLEAGIASAGVDALLMTGDVYDAVNPPVAAQQMLYRFLARALAAVPHLQVVLTGGNHDSAARVELPRHLLDAGRVHLIGGMAREDGRVAHGRTCVVLRDGAGTPRAVCAAVPYLRPGDLGEDGVAGLYAAVAGCAEALRVRDGAPESGLPLIVTGHLHVVGGEISALSERRILVGGEEAVPVTAFPAHAAYVALGHLHRPQALSGLGAVPVRYAGSPIPLSVTEREYRHSVVVVDLGADAVCRTALAEVPRHTAFLRVPRAGAAPLDVVEQALRDLPDADPGPDRHPFLEVEVALAAPEPDLRRRVEAALEGKKVRLVRLRTATAGTGTALADAAPAPSLIELDPERVFAARCEERFGEPPAAELRDAFRELLAGVLAPPDPPAAAPAAGSAPAALTPADPACAGPPVAAPASETVA